MSGWRLSEEETVGMEAPIGKQRAAHVKGASSSILSRVTPLLRAYWATELVGFQVITEGGQAD